MSQEQQECKSLKLNCEECGAEVVITTLFAPPFRDPSPTCPYCHFPLTSERDFADSIIRLRQAADDLERFHGEAA